MLAKVPRATQTGRTTVIRCLQSIQNRLRYLSVYEDQAAGELNAAIRMAIQRSRLRITLQGAHENDRQIDAALIAIVNGVPFLSPFFTNSSFYNDPFVYDPKYQGQLALFDLNIPVGDIAVA